MDFERITPSGLVIAIIGFTLTRSTVTLTVTEGTRAFVFLGLVPLVVGLLLTTLGVVLAVGSFEPEYVRTSAVWCCIGFLSMSVLVVFTVLGTDSWGVFAVLRTDPWFANFLLGGSAGGTLTGMYAARTRRERRASRNRANRLVVLNRILREEIINAAAVIRSHAEVAVVDRSEAEENGCLNTIIDRADDVTETIENVGDLTRTAQDGDGSFRGVSAPEAVAAAVEEERRRYPDAEIRVTHTEDVAVYANERLEGALCRLIENGVVHNDAGTPTVEVAVEATADRVCISVADDGPGLPDDQQSLIETGEIAEYDDPDTGFGLNVVRLLVESFGGGVETTVTDEGTTITLVLRRVELPAPAQPDLADVRSYGVPLPRLGAAIVAALVAGFAMGATLHVLAGMVPIIGALYGVTDPVVGWITHQFHSVVFGLMYAAFLGVAPGRYRGLGGHLLVALAWGTFLWLFAAGVVMPVWLRLVGMPAPLPNLKAASFVGHVVWGVTLGAVFYVLTNVVRFDVARRLHWGRHSP